MTNQCDGCQRGLPVNESGHHVGVSSFDIQACTAERYHDYTQAELNEFRDLVEMSESQDQMDRINSRLKMPEFVERVGRDKCDQMFEVLKKELEENQ